MVIGIGIDYIRVDRVRRALERTPSLEDRLFTPREIAYCRAKAFPAQHFAARFAAKEAVMKALGKGWTHGVRFRDVEVVLESDGKPGVEIHGDSRKNLPDRPHRILVSLTHDRTMAGAVAVIETL